MLRRVIWGAVCGAVVVVTACGGTVRENGSNGTPREQLQANGPNRCQAACATLTRCGVESQSSCDCSCACPVDAPGCECGPCECPPEVTSPEKCAEDCSDSVQEILSKTPECDGAMLALLSCLGGATCPAGGDSPCKAEQGAMKDCSRGSPDVDEPPSSGGGISTDPGAVYCGGVSSGGSNAPGAAPDSLVCDNGWSSCSDGREYAVACKTPVGGVFTCSCFVDGGLESTFVPPAVSCVQTPADANAWCGWQLR